MSKRADARLERASLSVPEYLAIVNGQGMKAPKYGNHAVRIDGQRFDSKLEAKRYQQLLLLRTSGIVKWFIRQAPFRLASGTIYRADFLIVWASGEVTVEDVKGMMTPVSLLKITLVEHQYGIRVTIVTKEAIG